MATSNISLMNRWELARSHPQLAGVEVKGGNVPRVSVVHKFGAADVGQKFETVAKGTSYVMKAPAAASPVRVAAGNAADDTGSTGAGVVTVQGLDTGGNEISEDIRLLGTTASDHTALSFLRVFRAFVKESGTYADTGTPSHVGRIVVEDTGGRDFVHIDTGDYPVGQSEIACYTIPKGYTGFVSGAEISVNSNKLVDLLMYVREGVADTVAPYSAMRERLRFTGIGAYTEHKHTMPIGPYTGPADIIWKARTTTGSAEVEIDTEILLMKN